MAFTTKTCHSASWICCQRAWVFLYLEYEKIKLKWIYKCHGDDSGQKKGVATKSDLEAGLKRSIQGDWEWSTKEIDNGSFVQTFPNMEVLDRVLAFEDFTLKGSGLSISVSKWNVATLAKKSCSL
jgi:hypothetical protein